MDAFPAESAAAAAVVPSPAAAPPSLGQQVRAGVIWKSGSQILGQLIAWTSTFLVIRLLDPSDYGLVAMTGVILTFLDLFNGWGFASPRVRDDKPDGQKMGQAFAMLILINGAPAAAQLAAAPFAPRYFHQPM